jgi:glycosyltransferase involved in cell wall biosynthesis
LARKNFEVNVYTSDYTNGELPSSEHIDGFTITRYIKLKNYIKPGSRNISPLVKYTIATSKLLGDLIEDSDAIIINEMPIIHLFTLPRNKKVIVDWCEYYRYGFRKFILDSVAKRIDFSISVAEPIAEKVRRINPRSKVQVIRTPLPIEKYISTSHKKDNELILYIGRLVPHKNIINLAKALVILNLKMGIKKRLVIAGEGPLKNTLLKMFSRYSFIEILGYVSEEKKIDLLNKAWLLAIPSLREGLPNVVAEAIASTTPILTVNSPLNGTAEFVKLYKIGVIASSGSPYDIAKAIASMNDGIIEKIMIREKRLREEFKESRVIEELVTFLKLLEG